MQRFLLQVFINYFSLIIKKKKIMKLMKNAKITMTILILVFQVQAVLAMIPLRVQLIKYKLNKS